MSKLPNAKAVAIALPQKPKNYQLINTSVLYSVLKKQSKDIKILLSGDGDASKTKLQALGISADDFVSKLPKPQFLLSFKKGDSDIEKVQWQQDDKNLSIYVSLSKGELNASDLKVERVGKLFEMILLPGVENLSQIGDIYTQNEDYFKSVKLVSIGSDINPGEDFKVDSFNKPNLTTLAEQVFEVLDSNEIDGKLALMLQSAIMLETNNLTKGVKSGETFMIMKKLVDKGANTDKTKDISQKAGEDKPKSDKPSNEPKKDDSKKGDSDKGEKKQDQKKDNQKKDDSDKKSAKQEPVKEKEKNNGLNWGFGRRN